jgi:hypothetical protein
MAHITFRLSSGWSEAALHRFDLALDLLERAARSLLADKDGSFGREIQAVRVRRLAAHGCSGQALI